MRKIVNLGLIILTFLLMTACEKEKEAESDIKIIENELNAFISDNGITKCDVYLMFGEQVTNKYREMDFSINNGFVIIKGVYYQDKYSLLFLAKYSFSTDKKLQLYFSSTHY